MNQENLIGPATITPPRQTNKPLPKPDVEPIRQTSNHGRAVKTLKVARCLGAGLLLSVVAFQAGAADKEATTYWNRIQEKDFLERLWEAF